jgi:Transglutaminase-like superfamily
MRSAALRIPQHIPPFSSKDAMDCPEPSGKQYFLARDAYACAAGDQLVFLELHSGKYLRIASSSSGALEKRVSGWPATGARKNRPEVLQDLLERGVLTTDITRGKEATFARMPTPARALVDVVLSAASRIKLRDVYAFFKAVSVAKRGLGLKNLKPMVDRVRQRKAAAAKPATIVDQPYLRGLLEIFDTLRPFAFGTHDVCLLHSVTLLEFLAQYRIFPAWVVGVQTTPFSAHSWVQYEEYVLSGTPTAVEMFTPILVV